LLDSFARQAALAIDRVQLAEQAKQAHLLHETERLQAALLNSISHDLRTPLSTITGALSSLRDDAAYLDEAARTDLIETAWEASDRLNWLVGNLLNMTRLEAGAVKVLKEPSDVEDAIGVALEQLAPRLRARTVLIDVPDHLPLVPMDFVLIVQVLVNLLDNAAKYAPLHSPIEVRVRLLETQVAIDVMDRGAGIPSEELQRIFDKFYRLEQDAHAGGTGLGLSIARSIVEAHGGRIWAFNRAEGGAVFRIALPLAWQSSVATAALTEVTL
jgi:two-component system sensor histidine kinase KdpD